MSKRSAKTKRARRGALLAGAATLIGAVPAAAAPTGGNVVAGDAEIQSLEGDPVIGVTQNSQNAIVEWQTFNLGADEDFFFDQPNAEAAILNRVLGSGGSVIDGDLTANGNVFIINSDGVMFGPNAVIDVNGLLTTSLDIADADFMNNDFDFRFLGEDDASIINKGDISIAESGILAFVAPNVANEGLIAARLGTVSLAAGDRFVIDFFGDGLVAFSPDIPSGENSGGINVTGPINAEGGAIYLTATDAIEFVETIINVEADLVARGAAEVGGKIILTGTDSTSVTVDAMLDASGGDGGEIAIFGGEILVTADASLLADGFEADFAGVAWEFQNAAFGGLDGGSTITGGFVYNADTDVFSNINVITSAGASLPGATYTVLGPDAGASLTDFLSTNAADITDDFRLRIGWNGPMTNAGGALNIAFGFEGKCQNNACGFPGFGIDLARGMIGSTSIVGVPLPIAGAQNGGTITVQSTEMTTFNGLASVVPGPTTGVGGQITLASDGLLAFDGETRIGAAPRAGMLTLVGLAPPDPDPDPDPAPADPPPDPPADEIDEDDEEEIDETVEVSLSEIAATQSNTEATGGEETSGDSGQSDGGEANNGDGGGAQGDAPPSGTAMFEGDPIIDPDDMSGGDEQERRLLCLLGIAEAACASN
ncbi:MAG: filamentous hemagglutinin N-terminal domain-containing protein [Pseudomonadota bacterium]